MKILNIDGILKNVINVVKNHELETGKYARWLWQNSNNSRELGHNAYGCADAANILYTLNEFPNDDLKRQKFVEALWEKQDSKTGIFKENTHHEFHTTAHCTAALELFDKKPLYPLYAMEKYKDINNLYKMLEDMDWLHCGKGAHAGAGLYAALVITESVDKKWENEYFGWFNENCDPNTGLWVKEPVNDFPVHLQMGDAFHYLFNYEYAKEAMPYSDKLIDSCLKMYDEGKMPEDFGRQFHFIEMDWVYCLNRASRQTPHRFYDVKETLFNFAKKYILYLNSVDWEKDEGANDLHLLFGTVCCLAELQQSLPSKITSNKPLRLVLDRRPFI